MHAPAHNSSQPCGCIRLSRRAREHQLESGLYPPKGVRLCSSPHALGDPVPLAEPPFPPCSLRGCSYPGDDTVPTARTSFLPNPSSWVLPSCSAQVAQHLPTGGELTGSTSLFALVPMETSWQTGLRRNRWQLPFFGNGAQAAAARAPTVGTHARPAPQLSQPRVWGHTRGGDSTVFITSEHSILSFLT